MSGLTNLLPITMTPENPELLVAGWRLYLYRMEKGKSFSKSPEDLKQQTGCLTVKSCFSIWMVYCSKFLLMEVFLKNSIPILLKVSITTMAYHSMVNFLR